MQQKKIRSTALPLIALAAGMLLFPSKASAEETTPSSLGVTIATGTTVIATDTTQIQPEYTGWQQIDGKQYYFDAESHQPVTGEQTIDGITYLFDFTGALKTGWRTVDGKRMYYDPKNGQPQIGWVTANGKRYYTDNSGKQTGEIQIDGIRYLLDSQTGEQLTGFCTFSDHTTSYYDDNGDPVNGWVDAKHGRYYFSDYVMQTGWQTIDGKRYYFNTSGRMQTGWQTIDNGKYHFSASGVMQTGLQMIDGKKYYFNTAGIMQTGWQTINQKIYYFFFDGAMGIGWQEVDGETYYFTDAGCAVGDRIIDGKTYHFGKTGCLTPSIIAWQQGDGAEDQRAKYLIGTRQWDNYVWTVCGENDQTIANSACGIFSVINSVYYKTQTFLDPITIADWAKAHGYRTAHAGVNERFFQAYANAYGSTYGFRCTGQLYSVDAALQHVRSGGTICANIPGHWIAVVDYDPKTGKYLLLDSAASYPRCTTISNWESTGVAWVSSSEFTQNAAYQFFVGNRKIYALSFGR